jgi:hypothetical protein
MAQPIIRSTRETRFTARELRLRLPRRHRCTVCCRDVMVHPAARIATDSLGPISKHQCNCAVAHDLSHVLDTAHQLPTDTGLYFSASAFHQSMLSFYNDLHNAEVKARVSPRVGGRRVPPPVFMPYCQVYGKLTHLNCAANAKLCTVSLFHQDRQLPWQL